MKSKKRKKIVGLFPKEHGAWAMWAIPLLLGSFVGKSLNLNLILIWLASLAVFTFRAPVNRLILLRNKKNSRVNREKKLLLTAATLYLTAAALAGSYLIFWAKLYWLIPLGIAGFTLLMVSFWFTAKRQFLSTPNELLGVAGLALGGPMAYYASTGTLDLTAFWLWLFSFLYFAGTIFYIRLKVRQQSKDKNPPQTLREKLKRGWPCISYHLFALSVVISIKWLYDYPVFLALAYLPITVKALWGTVNWERKVNPRKLGFIELFHSIVFTSLLLLALLK